MHKPVTARFTALLLACVVSVVLPALANAQRIPHQANPQLDDAPVSTQMSPKDVNAMIQSFMAQFAKPIVQKVNKAVKGATFEGTDEMVRFKVGKDSTPAAIVIDGKQVPALNSNMDASSVTNIEVLTDPDSRKKYGAQSVIVITTDSTKK